MKPFATVSRRLGFALVVTCLGPVLLWWHVVLTWGRSDLQQLKHVSPMWDTFSPFRPITTWLSYWAPRHKMETIFKQMLCVLDEVDHVGEAASLPLVQAWMALGEAILSSCCKRPMKLHYQMWPAEGSVIKYELDLQSPKMIQSVFVGLKKTNSSLNWSSSEQYKENMEKLQRNYIEKNIDSKDSLSKEVTKIKSESVGSDDEVAGAASDVDEMVGDGQACSGAPLRVSTRKRRLTPKAEAMNWRKKVQKSCHVKENVSSALAVSESKEQSFQVTESETMVLAVELDEDWMHEENHSNVIEIKPSPTSNQPRRTQNRRSMKNLRSIISTMKTRSEPDFGDCVFYCVICLKEKSLGIQSPGAEMYEFETRLSLKNHIVKQHNSSPGQNGNSVNCVGCNKRFFSRDVDALYVYRFLKHMEDIHECRYYREKKQNEDECGDERTGSTDTGGEKMQQQISSPNGEEERENHSPLKMVVDEFKCPHCILENDIDMDSVEANEHLFPTRLALRNHIIEDHSIITYSPKKTKSMTCIRCNKKFFSRDAGHGYIYRYLNHIQYAHGVTYFKYGNPKRVKHAGQYNAQSVIEWGRHFLGFNANLIYLCVFCHKDHVLEGISKNVDSSEFMCRDELSKHIEDTHMEVTDDSESLNCPLCPYNCTFKVGGFASQLICRIMYHIEDHHRILYFFLADDLSKGTEAVISVKSEERPSPPCDEADDGHHDLQKDSDSAEESDAKLTVRNLQLLKCALCKQEFEDDALLKQHWSTEHTNSGSITCEICAETCFSEQEYHAHAWLRHKLNLTGRELQACTECGLQIADVAMDRHLRRHRNNDAHQCELCGLEIIGEGNFKKHQANHKEKPPPIHLCSLCGSFFASAFRLRSHMAAAHGGQLSKCKHCKYYAESEEKMEKHMNKAHAGGQKLNYCEICKRQLVDLYSYENHMFVAHKMTVSSKRKVETCAVCGTETMGKMMMRRHMKIHEAQMPVSCEKCGKEYKSKALYLRHYEMVHAEKKHFCPECQEGFSRKYFLIRHMSRLHKYTSGIYYCQLCSYSAANPASYRTHLIKKHNIGQEEEQAKLVVLEQHHLEAEARGQLIKMARKQRRRSKKQGSLHNTNSRTGKNLLVTSSHAATTSVVPLIEDGSLVTKRDLADVSVVEEVSESAAVISAAMETGMTEVQLGAQDSIADQQGSTEVNPVNGMEVEEPAQSGMVSKVLLWDGIKTVEVEIPEVHNDSEAAQILTTDGSSVLVQTEGGDVQSEPFQFTVDLSNPNAIDNDPSVQYVVYLNE